MRNNIILSTVKFHIKNNLIFIISLCIFVAGCDVQRNDDNRDLRDFEIPPYDKNMFPDSTVLDCIDSVFSIFSRPDIYSARIPITTVERFVKTTVIPLIESDVTPNGLINYLERTRVLTLRTDFGRDTLSIPMEQLLVVPDSVRSKPLRYRYLLDVLPVPKDLVLVRVMLECKPDERVCGTEFFLFLKKDDNGYKIAAEYIMEI